MLGNEHTQDNSSFCNSTWHKLIKKVFIEVKPRAMGPDLCRTGSLFQTHKLVASIKKAGLRYFHTGYVVLTWKLPEPFTAYSLYSAWICYTCKNLAMRVATRFPLAVTRICILEKMGWNCLLQLDLVFCTLRHHWSDAKNPCCCWVFFNSCFLKLASGFLFKSLIELAKNLREESTENKFSWNSSNYLKDWIWKNLTFQSIVLLFYKLGIYILKIQH